MPSARARYVGRWSATAAAPGGALVDEDVRVVEPYTTRVRSRMTRNGVHVAAVALFAVLGGSIRGFNLLVILAGLIIGGLIIQWRFSRGSLPGLSLRCRLPSEAFVGRPFRVHYTVGNHQRFLAAWSVRVEDQIAEHDAPGGKQSAGCAIPLVVPGASEASSYECTIRRRGRYRFGPARLVTGFPLGLIEAQREVGAPSTLTVYPRLAELMPNWAGILQNEPIGAAARRSSGPNEGEFFGIRQWQTGDSQRWIHWRTTARSGRLAVRQFEKQHRTRLLLLVDPYREDPKEDVDVEWAISVAAAMVADISALPTNRVWLGVADAAGRAMASHRSSRFRREAMGMLASAQPTAKPSLSATLARMLAEGDVRWPLMVISPRTPRFDLLSSSDADDRDESNGCPGVPRNIVRALDLTWIDVTSESAKRIAMRREMADEID